MLSLAGLVARAQAPAWQAAVAITTNATGAAYANATATDAAGNVYVAGQFSGTVSLGSFSFTTPANVGTNGFIAKWNPTTQSFVWARQLGGVANSVAVLGTLVYVAGYFSGTAGFGNTTLTSAGDDDAYVARVVDAGSSSILTWAQRGGGPGSDRAEAVAVTSAGLYVSGEFAQTATFGATALTAMSSRNAFVAKLTDSGSAGSFTWAQPITSITTATAYALAAAGPAVYVVGWFAQGAVFGTTGLGSTGASTAYVAKLVDAGTTSSFSWAQAPANGVGAMYAGGVAVVGTHVYLCGRFTDTVNFGPLALTTAGYSDIFVTRLTDSGSAPGFDWVQQAGGTDDDNGQRMAVVGTNVYLSGSFRGTARFGATTLTSAGGGDVFVSRLTDLGTSAAFAWTQQAGGAGNDGGYGLALSGTRPVVVGSFNATASFGTQAITSTSTTSENAFVALLGPDVLATTSATTLPGLALYPNPAHGTATVRVPAGPGPANLVLCDALGRVVRTTTAPAGQDYALGLAGLATGVYALHVQVGEGQATQKLVVE